MDVWHCISFLRRDREADYVLEISDGRYPRFLRDSQPRCRCWQWYRYWHRIFATVMLPRKLASRSDTCMRRTNEIFIQPLRFVLRTCPAGPAFSESSQSHGRSRAAYLRVKKSARDYRYKHGLIPNCKLHSYAYSKIQNRALHAFIGTSIHSMV